MIRKILPFALIFTMACGSQSQKKAEENTASKFGAEIHEAFINNLKTLCGKSFAGEQTYRSHHGESWAERNLIMHVTVCRDDKVHIPFHVDEDHSRTWMFDLEDGKLRFRHQHLHEDGTHEEGSMYGGYADEKGSAFVQYFPADEYSAQAIEDGGGNVWTVSLAEDLSWFSYRLDRDGEKRFEIRFDLTIPIVH